VNDTTKVVASAIILAAGVGLIVSGYSPAVSIAGGASRGATLNPIFTTIGLAAALVSGVFLLQAVRNLLR
jgi:hypothetical protein